uniref:Uncharacterized protein n=1 Tax=Knipowitschia caucasica TaxID=637954 RepID=A0AAV2LU33_KNICA
MRRCGTLTQTLRLSSDNGPSAALPWTEVIKVYTGEDKLLPDVAVHWRAWSAWVYVCLRVEKLSAAFYWRKWSPLIGKIAHAQMSLLFAGYGV